jgi:GxxExxY protein
MVFEKEQIDILSNKIIGSAIEVHKVLGPGLLESAYEECLCYEMKFAGIQFERQVPLPVIYKSSKLDCGYRLDLVIENAIILELKSVETLLPIHDSRFMKHKF